MEKCYSIPSIDCSACAIVIEEALEELSGVKKAQVNVGKQIVDVEFDEAKVGEPQIVHALTDAGYPPRPAEGGASQT